MVRRKRAKKVGPTRGFGARYGVTVRRRYSEIASKMRKDYKCPRCGLKTVRRESVGIWVCRKCGLRFAGGAYAPTTKLGVEATRSARGS